MIHFSSKNSSLKLVEKQRWPQGVPLFCRVSTLPTNTIQNSTISTQASVHFRQIAEAEFLKPPELSPSVSI